MNDSEEKQASLKQDLTGRLDYLQKSIELHLLEIARLETEVVKVEQALESVAEARKENQHLESLRARERAVPVIWRGEES